MQQLYLKDPNKITSYYIRDENKPRNSFSSYKYQSKRPINPIRRESYRDYDEPEHEVTKKVIVGAKPIVNFLDI